MFELTVHFKHEMIGKKLWIKWNFELTVFELSVPDLYWIEPIISPNLEACWIEYMKSQLTRAYCTDLIKSPQLRVPLNQQSFQRNYYSLLYVHPFCMLHKSFSSQVKHLSNSLRQMVNVFDELTVSKALAKDQLIHWKHDTRGIFNKLLRDSFIHLQEINCLWSQLDESLKCLKNIYILKPVSVCEVGFHYPQILDITCSSCPIGTYKNHTGIRGCIPCPEGTTAIHHTSVDDCTRKSWKNYFKK